MLKQGQYSVSIDPDNTAPETRAVREARALKMYMVMKDNPMIDPQRLTEYLLHEVHGVQFDDMMRQLPRPENPPNGAISPEQFGQLTAQQAARGAQNGQRRGQAVGQLLPGRR